MGKSESEIQQQIQMNAVKQGCLLMRNNSGAFQDKTGRWVRYGLGHISPNQETKSSDLVGPTTITITPEMVGKSVAIFTAMEIKPAAFKFSESIPRHVHQKNFIDWIKLRGGIAGFASSVEESKQLIDDYIADLKK